jgi:hypothetical protein
MKALALLVLVPLAGCPRGGHPADPKAPPGEVYAGLFEAQRSWTYQVSEHQAGQDETYEVTCEVTDQLDVAPDGRLGFVSCDRTIGEGMQEAVNGLWAANKRGLWYLPDYAPGDDGLSAMPSEAMTDDRMLLPAVPVAGTRQLLDPATGQPAEEVTVEHTEEGWCRGARSLLGDSWWARICFDAGGVSSGQLGWSGENDHKVEFAEAE